MSDSGVVNGECAYSEERCSSQEILQRDSGFVGMDIPVSVCADKRYAQTQNSKYNTRFAGNSIVAVCELSCVPGDLDSQNGG